ncbi:MAG: UDP-glucose dehydrogenase family protein, partial [Pontibacterium sp.]
MKVTVFGIGYVGLVQATIFAELGHEVVCVDVDETKIENLKQGIVPIFEPGLTPLVEKNYAAERLIFTTDAKFGVEHGKVQFIAVGTPPDEDGSADLKYVLSVAETIATYMQAHQVVVDKSTVPVGTADKVSAQLQATLDKRGSDLTFDVVSNPEFLKEGSAIDDCMKPDRIVIGTDNPDAEAVMHELYDPFSRSRNRMIVMDIRSAELTKYAANCMLATKISFINELSNLAELLGADIEKVRVGIGSDSRIGYSFIYPGAGYGGSCFPKDVQALVRTAQGVDFQPRLLEAVEAVNAHQKTKLFSNIQKHFGADLTGKTFAIWGLSFKPNTDDMREATSRVLMEALWAAGARVQAFDPEAMNEAQRIYGNRSDLMLAGTKESALQGADALVICTEWKEFYSPDFDLLKECLSSQAIFDGRNLYDPERLKKQGFAYYGIGRGESINR